MYIAADDLAVYSSRYAVNTGDFEYYPDLDVYINSYITETLSGSITFAEELVALSYSLGGDKGILSARRR